MDTNERNEIIDIMKGVGIFLMVWGHVDGPLKTPYVYLFHMALFFIVSGYVYKYKANESLIVFAKKKALRLYVPHLVSGMILVTLTNVFVRIHLLDVSFELVGWTSYLKKYLSVILFGGGDSLLGANWFLRSMFFGYLLYNIENRIIRSNKKKVIMIIINLVLLCIGWLLTLKIGQGKLLNILSVPALFSIGAFLNEMGIIKRISKLLYLLLPASILALFLLGFCGEISLNNNRIVNPVFFLTCALVGFIFAGSLAVLINKILFLKKVFLYLGKNTMCIVLLHFISLKIITLLQIVFYGASIENLECYPTYITNGAWWIAYLLVGIAVPLVLCEMYKMIIRKIRNRNKKIQVKSRS